MNETQCIAQSQDYPQPTTSNSELRSINVQPLSRGYVLNVGCQSIAVSNKDSLKQLLNMYIDNPQQTEDDYYAGKILPKE